MSAIRAFPRSFWMANVMESFARVLPIEPETFRTAALVSGQVKPEFMINLNAGAIVLFQVFIAYLVRKTTPLTSIIAGVTVTVVSFLLYLAGNSGFIVLSAILVFSLGEMLASPRSKEYAGRIAPPGRRRRPGGGRCTRYNQAEVGR